MYRPEDESISITDKIILHGKGAMTFCDGGSALHMNLEGYPSKEGFSKLIDTACIEGCEYFCFNVKVTHCEDCKYIDKSTKYECSKCGSKDISHMTRVIGYLKKVKDFSSDRRKEENIRRYHAQV